MTYKTIVSVIGLICVSGFIAYIGDLLGRKMGKKRLTLFHMRPRHTAIVVTTITGMLISTLALITLVSVNTQFRKVLLTYEQILQQNRRFQSSNRDLVKRGRELRAQVAKQEREVTSALRAAKLARRQRDMAVGSVATLRKEIARRQSELSALRKRQDIAESELRQREGELQLTLSRLEAAEHRVELKQSELVEVERKLGAAQASLQKVETQLAQAENTMAETYGIGDVAADLALRLRMSEIAFRQGDELARGIIKPGQSDFELRRDLFALLERASKKAADSGAKLGKNDRAVSVMHWQMTDKSRALVIEDEHKCVDLAVEKMGTSNRDVMVQVVCGMNTLPDAQVPVELRLYVNELVYKNGDRIASAGLDGSETEGSILLALSDFLQVDAAKAAMLAGVVPLTGQDPRSALGANRQAQADELLRIVGKIKSMNAETEVSLYATADVHTADSLNMNNVRFSVAKSQ